MISACNYRRGHGNVELWYYSCKILFRSCRALEFLLLVHLWTGLLSTACWCFTNTCLTLFVQRYINRQSVWARKWNFDSRSWPLYLFYHHILLPVHIMPCLVHCKTVFSVLNTYRAWQSGVSLSGRYNYDCDRYCPNGWGMPNETVCFSFIPRH